MNRVGRAALWLLCLALVAGAVFLMALDQHYAGRSGTDVNCGNAIIATDTAKVSISTGNIDEDNFTQDDIVVQCAHLITRQRVFVGMVALGAIAAAIGARYLRHVELSRVDIPGDRIV